MVVIIDEIKIFDEHYSFLDFSEVDFNKGQILQNLSKINIFVGANNSGKSRLLRALLSSNELSKSIDTKPLEFKPSDNSIKEINCNISNLNLPENNIFETLQNDLLILKTEMEDLKNDTFSSIKHINEIKKIHAYLDEIKLEYLFSNDENVLLPLEKLKKHLEKLIENRQGGTIDRFSFTYIGNSYNDQLSKFLGKWGEGILDVNFNFNFKKIYIPILRGLRSFDNKDIYFTRTTADYFGHQTEEFLKSWNFEIYTGLKAYKDIKDHLLGNHNQRKMIKDFEEFLSQQFFDNQRITLIPKESSDEVLTVKIGDEKEMPIYNLGDGIQSVIIMTLPLYLCENLPENENVLVFIEEPEHYLHPGLQRKLMDTFNDFKGFQFFATTHSNHFLDLSLDYENVSIFSVKKEVDDDENEEKTPNFFVESLSYGDVDALELLGVRKSSVFLSNCTIWVEGITDRYYLKKYFDVYQNFLKEKAEEIGLEFMEFDEDYHYSFVEYAGSNITHWSFLEGLNEEDKINVDNLCGNLFLISDADDENSKIERKEKLRTNLGKRYCQLTVREIENLLTENVLLEVLKDFEMGNDERENLEYNPFEHSEYKKVPIGKFIEENILISKKKDYQSTSGTIKNKLRFCKNALQHINTFGNLSDETIGVCNCIYKFIAKKNGIDILDYEEICENLGISGYNSNVGCQVVNE